MPSRQPMQIFGGWVRCIPHGVVTGPSDMTTFVSGLDACPMNGRAPLEDMDSKIFRKEDRLEGKMRESRQE